MADVKRMFAEVVVEDLSREAYFQLYGLGRALKVVSGSEANPCENNVHVG